MFSPHIVCYALGFLPLKLGQIILPTEYAIKREKEINYIHDGIPNCSCILGLVATGILIFYQFGDNKFFSFNRFDGF